MNTFRSIRLCGRRAVRILTVSRTWTTLTWGRGAGWQRAAGQWTVSFCCCGQQNRRGPWLCSESPILEAAAPAPHNSHYWDPYRGRERRDEKRASKQNRMQHKELLLVKQRQWTHIRTDTSENMPIRQKNEVSMPNSIRFATVYASCPPPPHPSTMSSLPLSLPLSLLPLW